MMPKIHIQNDKLSIAKKSMHAINFIKFLKSLFACMYSYMCVNT